MCSLDLCVLYNFIITQIEKEALMVLCSVGKHAESFRALAAPYLLYNRPEHRKGFCIY